MPVYVQPEMPAQGYLWVPGYWAWDDNGDYYYWVPGTWVLPPEPGLLWTPGYWGWSDGVYLWHEGYWGRHVGFYGGVDYGFGYGPRGYDGGYWDHGVLYYNTAVNRVPPDFRGHVYHHPVPGGGEPGRVSFNGGEHGVHVQPTREQLEVAHEPHVMPIGAQRQLASSASHNQQLRADFNHGHPAITATPRPEAFARGASGEAGRGPEPRSRVEPGAAPSVGHSSAAVHEHFPATRETQSHAQPAHEPVLHEAPPREQSFREPPPHGVPQAVAHSAPSHAASAHPAEERGGGHPNPNERRRDEQSPRG
ncbi:MAG TPA: hypothetical protein VKT19_05475 [Steroidobacteraceae bacterium]|nr:hypothetical protein [Steroidobacteraceae bacterium]